MYERFIDLIEHMHVRAKCHGFVGWDDSIDDVFKRWENVDLYRARVGEAKGRMPLPVIQDYLSENVFGYYLAKSVESAVRASDKFGGDRETHFSFDEAISDTYDPSIGEDFKLNMYIIFNCGNMFYLDFRLYLEDYGRELYDDALECALMYMQLIGVSAASDILEKL